jgi:hypothetical protein
LTEAENARTFDLLNAEIDRLRELLYEEYHKQKDFSHPELLKISQTLDQMLNQQQQLTVTKRVKP